MPRVTVHPREVLEQRLAVSNQDHSHHLLSDAAGKASSPFSSNGFMGFSSNGFMGFSSNGFMGFSSSGFMGF